MSRRPRRCDPCRLTSRFVHFALVASWIALVVWKILNFMSEPTASETRFEDGFDWPYLTICPYDIDSDISTLGKWDETRETLRMLYENHTMLELFQNKSLSLLDMLDVRPGDLFEYYRKGYDREFRQTLRSSLGSWREKFDYAQGGLCSTLNVSDKMQRKSEDFMLLKLKRRKQEAIQPATNQTRKRGNNSDGNHATFEVQLSYKILIHKLDDFWGGQESQFTRYSESEMASFIIPYDTNREELEIHPERDSMPNLRRRPCEGNPDYSRSTCWRDCFLESLNCSLLEGDDTNDKPTCTAVDSTWFLGSNWPARIFYDKFRSDEKRKQECSCPRPCSLERYKLFVQPNTRSKSSETWIQIAVSLSPLKRMTETYVTYGIIDLLADIGGFVGLLLGYSLLSVFEDLKGFVTRLYRRRAVCAPASHPGEPQQPQVSNVKPTGDKRRVKQGW